MELYMQIILVTVNIVLVVMIGIVLMKLNKATKTKENKELIKVIEEMDNLKNKTVTQTEILDAKLQTILLTQTSTQSSFSKSFTDNIQKMNDNIFRNNESLKSTINQNNEKSLMRSSLFERELNEVFSKKTENINAQIEYKFKALTETVEKYLTDMQTKVDERLDKSFSKTNETFNSVLERLAKIDEAQKKIESLSTNIVSLQDVLTDKKARGTFGEIQLNQLLVAVFGEKNESIYKMQYKLPNATIVDACVFLPSPIGKLGIDSKFPLENYQKMVDRTLPDLERLKHQKMFKIDVKKHIDAIASKYIIEGVTSHQAIMFIPAEAIFAEINAYHYDLVEYAHTKKVWLVSPTTFMSTLTTIQVLLNNIERDKHAKTIHLELQKLGVEFSRYQRRWEKLSKNIETVSKNVRDLDTTTVKIGKKFDSISKVEIENLDEYQIKKALDNVQ